MFRGPWTAVVLQEVDVGFDRAEIVDGDDLNVLAACVQGWTGGPSLTNPAETR